MENRVIYHEGVHDIFHKFADIIAERGAGKLRMILHCNLRMESSNTTVYMYDLGVTELVS